MDIFANDPKYADKLELARKGVDELRAEKLPDLLELKYKSVFDAAKELGELKGIRDAFVGFQGRLYE